MKLTNNFQLSEFACNDGTPVPADLIPNVKNLAEQLQVIRDTVGEPIIINSGYRSPSWNKKVEGKPNSQHLLGKAADIVVKSKTPRQLAKIIEKLIDEGKIKIGGVGVYRSFVHVDTRRLRARW